MWRGFIADVGVKWQITLASSHISTSPCALRIGLRSPGHIELYRLPIHASLLVTVAFHTNKAVQDAPDAPKIREFYRVEELQSPSDPSGLISSCPPRYIADFLVRAFFNHAEGNYFYVDRTWLNRKMDLVYDAPASLSRRDVPMLCVLFMVLAIGTQYAYLDSDAWRHGGGVEEVNTFSEDSVGIMLYQQACKLLPDVITISSSESVQACLLIGLYTLPLDPSGLSWVYLGLAMKLAVQNGMHRRYPGQSSDLAMVETRNRVWWTCYMVEKWVESPSE